MGSSTFPTLKARLCAIKNYGGTGGAEGLRGCAGDTHDCGVLGAAGMDAPGFPRFHHGVGGGEAEGNDFSNDARGHGRDRSRLRRKCHTELALGEVRHETAISSSQGCGCSARPCWACGLQFQAEDGGKVSMIEQLSRSS